MSEEITPTEPTSAPSPPEAPAADYRAPAAPVDDPSKRPPPGTTIARVGDRYRLTYGFVDRWLKRYGWHVRRKQMPTAIRDRLHGQGYSKAVNAKSDYLLEEVAKIDSTTSDERALHGAFCAIASNYGFPQPPRPVFPDDPPPPPGKGRGNGGGQKPKGQPDGGDGKGEPDGQDGEGDGDSQQNEGDGQGDSNEGGDQQPQDGDGEGKGDGEGEQPSNDDGQPDGGDGKGDTPPDGEAQGGGFGQTDEENEKPITERPDYGAAEDEVVESDGRAEEAAPTVQPDLSSFDFHAPPPKKTKKHPIGRLPVDWLEPKRHVIDASGFNALLARVREELMSVSRHRRTYEKDSGDLDFRKVVDIATGQNLDRIFYRTTHARRLNTAVQLFVDFSGSMQGSPMMSGNSLSVMMAELFEKLRVPCEVIGFMDDAYLMKGWEERAADSPIGRLRGMGGTNLYRSMVSGLKSLTDRREERLIQAVITDGEIDHGEADRCRGLLGSDRRLETYGFFIGMQDQYQPFLRSVDELRPSNMVEKILTTLGHVVAGGPRHARAA